MSEAVATAPAAPPSAPTTAGATLASVPPPSAPSAPSTPWFDGFKNAELKTYISQKNFSDPEKLAESYHNLEKLKGVPEDRLIRLPEKLEGDEAKNIFQRLGAPKEAKEYAIPRDEKSLDPGFADWAESAFHKSNITKSQAEALVQEYNSRLQGELQTRQTAFNNSLKQADETLKSEWGPHYEKNINLAKQGAKILGLDPETLNVMEAAQGREKLFKTLQKIGVGLSESNFVDGQNANVDPTPEQARSEMQKLMQDKKFQKAWNKGDMEARERWDKLNRLAAPGEKTIG